MSFPALTRDPAIERHIRRRRLVRNIIAALVIALVVVGVMRTWGAVRSQTSSPHVATKTVTLVSAEPQGDEVHVRARLDAPSVDATSHEIDALVPASTWKITHVLWACYPPNDPARGTLRTPLDPDCTHVVSTK